MQKTQFKQSYRAARIGQVNQDTLESVAAIIALQDARKPDLIGKVYRDAMAFQEFIEGRHEKRERLADLRSRRRARRGEYQVELPVQEVGPECYHDSMMVEFDSVYADR